MTADEHAGPRIEASFADGTRITVFNAADAEREMAELIAVHTVQRIWSRDATLWSDDPQTEQAIFNRLGWLQLGAAMAPGLPDLVDFAQEVRGDGIRNVVLLGMGGSSLCPEVLAATFGISPGYPRLRVLDTTDPATVLEVERSIAIEQTLLIVASKSGGTIEPDSLFRFFFEKMKAALGSTAGNNVIAITDPGTSLARQAGEMGFRHAFLAPADVGGRYSALTHFGLVPGALIGARIGAIFERAGAMSENCSASRGGRGNAGLLLGAAVAGSAKRGRDKLTFAISPELAAFGVWAEQLIAESTGKNGVGLLPIEGETLGGPEVYSNDRVFAAICLEGSRDRELTARIDALVAANHPVVRVNVQDETSIGGLFLLWEFATAVCGAAMRINPFDEPNVKESKDNTAAILEEYQRTGAAPGISESATNLDATDDGELAEIVREYMASAREGDYFAINAYLQRHEPVDGMLRSIRGQLRDTSRCATAIGYGPRFLHSTGQFHKGGTNTGIFLQLTADDTEDVPVPGRPFGLSVLKQAQAFGDFQALRKHGRRVTWVHLGRDGTRGLQRLEAAFLAVCAQ